MAERLKEVTDEKVYTEDEAKALIEKFKELGMTEGFEVVKASYTLKEKKSKGEVIDSWYVVSVTKRWSV